MSKFRDGYLELYEISNNKDSIYVNEKSDSRVFCDTANLVCKNKKCYLSH